ncbi:hypothetical protein [Nibricoccus sp. IMCC34717]|uniref:hypothetical protein n=1 Tax=Nibricoccus sp. IMCC34717 TaxID=3034021 RepID=UPI00384E1F40
MIPAAAESLPCPLCHRGRDALVFADDGRGRCNYCHESVEIATFPAFNAPQRRIRPRAVAVDASNCFYHATNQAEQLCDDCGRFLCGVCAVENASRVLCPKCLSLRAQSDETHVQARFIYSGAVARLAFLPLLMWPLTLVTAPAALVLAFIGWKKPPSIVGGGRAGLVIGSLAALVQCILWGVLFFNLLRSALR